MGKHNEWTKENGDFFTIASLSAFIAALNFIVATSTSSPRPAKPFNFGFGPEMSC